MLSAENRVDNLQFSFRRPLGSAAWGGNVTSHHLRPCV